MFFKSFNLFVLLSMCQIAHTQNFVWNKVYGSNQMDVLKGLISSGSGKYLYTFNNSIDKKRQENAKLKINDSIIYSNKISSDWLVKFDTAGKMVWGKEVFYPSGPGSVKMISDEEDCIYLLFDINNPRNDDSFRIVENSRILKIDSGISVTFIVKLNSDGNLIWQKEIKNVITGFDINLIGNNIYFFIRNRLNQSFKFLNDTIKGDYSLIKMDTAGSFVDFFNLGNNKNNFIPNSKVFKANDSIIIHGVTFSSPLELGNSIVNNSLGFFNLIKIVINEKNKMNIRLIYLTKLNENKSFSLGTILKLRDNRYFYAGSFKDSITLFDESKIFNQSKKNIHFTFTTFNDRIISHFKFNTEQQNYSGQFLGGNSLNGFAYIIGSINGDISYFNKVSRSNEGQNVFCKFDSLSNLLWYVRAGDSVKFFSPLGFAIDENKGIYFGSSFEDSIKLNNHYYISDSVDKRDFVISKIYDFSITRGVVSKGPYCAGDTFLIPYSKDGQFQAQNEFIAELSDENGDFKGNHRTLGRLQTNKDSTIKGVLPLFDVVTSSKYRIRIISTHPPVQSYYRYDSLRLLIYSKDTAHAGNDTSVCYGSNTQLKTSGGSLWRWSPGSLVEDSTQRITQTKPIRQATQFRIIISDSSGCGKTDTTYKWVYPKTKITIHNTDTLVCKGSALLAMQVSGGNGNSFSYQWQTSNGLVLSNQQSFIYQDTFTKLVLIASDGCSENDTQLIQIKFYDSVKIQLFLANQQCKILPFVLKPPVVGGKGEYSYFWNNSNTAQTDSIIINAYGTLTYQLKVKDICPNYQDSLSFEYTIAEPLDYQIPNDTQLCYGNSLSIVPQIIKGQRTSLYYFYIKENQIIKDSLIGLQLLNKTFTESSSIDIRVKDACNQWIEKTINIDVLKPISFQGVNDTLVCNNQWFNLQATTLGGKSPKIIMKNSNGVVLKSAYFIDTVIFVNAPFTLQFESQDGCTNPQIQKVMQIKVTDSLKFKVEQSPLCFKDTVSLNANVTGGKPYLYGYSWMNEQGNMINLSDKSILFSSLNKPQKLIASVKNECGTIVDTLSILPQTLAMFSVNEKVQCFYNQNFEFINNSQSNGLSSYLWRVPNSFVTQQKNEFELKGVYSDSGLFETSLLAISKGVCKDSFSLMTEVKPKPTVKMEWQRTTNSYDYSEWRFTAQSNQTLQNYEWKINDLPPQNGNPIFVPFTNTGKVYAKVKVLDSYGCWTEISDSFMMVHRMRFYIPNAVTINNDGVNESFFIPGSEFMRTYHIEIYNRWGERVFESNNPNETFTPEYKGSDVYIYKLNIFDIYNERHLINGVFGVYR